MYVVQIKYDKWFSITSLNRGDEITPSRISYPPIKLVLENHVSYMSPTSVQVMPMLVTSQRNSTNTTAYDVLTLWLTLVTLVVKLLLVVSGSMGRWTITQLFRAANTKLLAVTHIQYRSFSVRC